VTSAGDVTLRFDGGLVAPLALIGSLVFWLLAVALLLGRVPGVGLARHLGRRPAGIPDRHPEPDPAAGAPEPTPSSVSTEQGS